MNKKLIELLALLGITVAADAGDDAVLAAANSAPAAITTLKQAQTDLTAATSAKTTLEGNVVALTNAKTGLESTLATEKTRADQAEAKFKDERKERAMLLANVAVTEGRITAAERDATVTALVNAADFTVAAADLAKKAKKLPTQSRAAAAATTTTANISRGERLLALVNAHMESAKVDYEKAHAHVASTEEGKAILAEMDKKTGA